MQNSQPCEDNCDTKGSHTTVEYRVTERVDTSDLSVEQLGPEEILKLFSLDLILLGSEGLREEREHLNKVLLSAVGKALAKAYPELVGHWEEKLPAHHVHPFSHIKPEEAAVRLMTPHYRKETEINEMVNLVVELQDVELNKLEAQHPDNLEFSLDLAHIRRVVLPGETPEAKVARLEAEQRVKMFVLQKGERIGHGDLLTFQKVRIQTCVLDFVLTLDLGEYSAANESHISQGDRPLGVLWAF